MRGTSGLGAVPARLAAPGYAYRMPDPDDEASLPIDSEQAPRASMNVDPDAPPAKPNEDEPTPQPPLKDQGDPLSEPRHPCR